MQKRMYWMRICFLFISSLIFLTIMYAGDHEIFEFGPYLSFRMLLLVSLVLIAIFVYIFYYDT